jgi:hypothetical protein
LVIELEKIEPRFGGAFICNYSPLRLVGKDMKQLTLVPTQNIVRILVAVGVLLLIPLVLTLLNSNASIYGGPGGGWDWMPGDFLVMGTLLFVTGLAIDLAIRNLTSPAARIAIVGAILLALFLIWIELAVDGVSQLIHFLLASL